MDNNIFATALGITKPWFIENLSFDAEKQLLSVHIDFKKGSRFSCPEMAGDHPIYDSRIKRYRHLNFFQHECHLEVRVPRVKLPDGHIVLIDPPWAGKLSGFTLLFEALILALCREMPFAAVARLVGLSWHRVHAICTRYVDLALAQADLSELKSIAIDETSRHRGQDYITVVTDADERKVIFVDEGHGSGTIANFATELLLHGSGPDRIESACIDMSPAYIRGVTDYLPNAKITFDKFHIIANASTALDRMRVIEQRTDASLKVKGLRWALLRDRNNLNPQQRADLDTLVIEVVSKRTARAWVYREQLRAILNRKQIHVIRRMLHQWCTNVNRSKVEPMKKVAAMIRSHMEGIVQMARSRQTNGFIEALNGLFQAAKRKARGYGRLITMRTVLFLIAGKLNFTEINPHAA